MSKRTKRKSIQNHALLAVRLNQMANVLRSKREPTDEEKQAAKDFENQAVDHERKAALFGQKFIMIL